MMMKKSVAIIENLCERRLLEYDRLNEYLHRNDIQVCSDVNQAEVLLFFSCGMKEDDTHQKVKQSLEHGRTVVLIGCASSMMKFPKDDRLKLIPLRKLSLLDDLFTPKIPFDRIPESVYSRYNHVKIKTYDEAVNTWDPRLFTPACQDVYSLKISTGCSRRCSYCAIRKAIGGLYSIRLKDITSEMEVALQKGYRHFRFQCENLSAYGEDHGVNLGVLLDALCQIKAPFDIDLPDLHPDGFIKYFDSIYRLVKNKNVYQIHIPIQSGSHQVLKKMAREYDVDELISKIKLLRQITDTSIIGTDIIVGFPSESESDFEKTCHLLESIHFDPLYVHGYYDKEGTLAAKMDNKVSSDIIERRIKMLQAQYPHAASYLNQYFEGRTTKNEVYYGESTI